MYVSHYVNVVNKKNNMICSINAEKAFEKISHLFAKKFLAN